MEWIVVIALIVFGISLIVIEIIFIPGTTVVGIIGFCMVLGGNILSFDYFGKSTGWLVVGGSVVTTGLFVYMSLRSKAWERFSLKSSMSSKVNEGALQGLKEGEEGVALSALRPSGKAEFGGKTYEVTTLGNFAETNTKVKIVRISLNQIVVEPIN